MREIIVKDKKNGFSISPEILHFGGEYKLVSDVPVLLKRDKEKTWFDFVYDGSNSIIIPGVLDNRNDIGSESVTRGLIYRYGENVIEEYMNDEIAPGSIVIDRKDVPAVALISDGKLLRYGKDYQIVIDVFEDGRFQDRIVFIRAFPVGSKMTFIWGLYHLGDVRGNGSKEIIFSIPEWYYRKVLFVFDLSLKKYEMMQLIEISPKMSFGIDSMTSEYILSFPAMRRFMEDYLRFHEQVLQPFDFIRNFQKYRFLDVKIESFLEHLKRFFGRDVFVSGGVDVKHFIHHVVDFFRHKGTPESFSFLMRALFNRECSIFIPKDKTLSLSDSPSHYDVFMYLEEIGSIISEGYGNRIQGVNINTIPSIPPGFIDEFNGKEIIGIVSGTTAFVEKVSEDVFSLHDVRGEFLPWEGIIIRDGDIIDGKVCVVIPSLRAFKIEDGGSGFSVGDNVYLNGKMVGYVSLLGKNNSVGAIKVIDNIKLKDIQDVVVRRRNAGSDCKLNVVVNATFKTKTNSDDTKSRIGNNMQDGFYWQDFSYEVVSSIPLSLYERQMRNVHPAGSKMFGRVNLKTGEVLTHEGYIPETFYDLRFGIVDNAKPYSKRKKEVILFEGDGYIIRGENEVPYMNGKYHVYRYCKNLVGNPFKPSEWGKSNDCVLEALDEMFFFHPAEVKIGYLDVSLNSSLLVGNVYEVKLPVNFMGDFFNFRLRDITSGENLVYRIYHDNIFLYSNNGNLVKDVKNNWIVFDGDKYLLKIYLEMQQDRDISFEIHKNSIVYGMQVSRVVKNALGVYGENYDTGWVDGERFSEKMYLDIPASGKLTLSFNLEMGRDVSFAEEKILAVVDSSYNILGYLDISFDPSAKYVHVAVSHNGGNDFYVSMNGNGEIKTISGSPYAIMICPRIYSHSIISNFKAAEVFVGEDVIKF